MSTPSCTLGGGGHSLVTHTALWGAAAICEQAGLPVRVCWSSRELQACLVGIDEAVLARAVREHAAALDAPRSWLQANTRFTDRVIPTMTPGPVALDDEQAVILLRDRETVLDRGLGWGDQLWLAAVGHPVAPVYWRHRRGEPVYGHTRCAASPLVMQTPRAGAELLGAKLRPLARVVAARSADAVADGLTGTHLVDDLHPDPAGSRTAAGLAPPGPVDSAVAWCALWGIGQTRYTPPRPVLDARTGAWDGGSWTRAQSSVHQWIGGHSGYVAAPVWHEPVPPARLRTWLAAPLGPAAAHPGEQRVLADGHAEVVDAGEVNQHRAALLQLAGLMRFDITVTTGKVTDRHAGHGHPVSVHDYVFD